MARHDTLMTMAVKRAGNVTAATINRYTCTIEIPAPLLILRELR